MPITSTNGADAVCKVFKFVSSARLPARATDGAAGYDLHSVHHCVVRPGQTVSVGTGIGAVMPTGSYGQVASRSSLALKGVTAEGGVIDPDYPGQI